MEKENPFEDLDVEEQVPEEILDDIHSNMNQDDLSFTGMLGEVKTVLRGGELCEVRSYHIAEKLNALSFLNSSQRLYQGNLTPAYSKVGQDLDIHPAVLRDWWHKRDKLLLAGRKHLELSQQIKAVQLSALLDKSMKSLEGVLDDGGFTKKDLKSLTSAMTALAQNSRLFENKSTKNVEHQHRGKIAYTMPDSVDDKE